jgi:hypothetical protein
MLGLQRNYSEVGEVDLSQDLAGSMVDAKFGLGEAGRLGLRGTDVVGTHDVGQKER